MAGVEYEQYFFFRPTEPEKRGVLSNPKSGVCAGEEKKGGGGGAGWGGVRIRSH